MKKLYLLLFVALLNYNSFGQSWIEPGAVWHYDYWNAGMVGFVRYAYTQDSIIDGNNCQRISGTWYLFVYNQSGNLVLLSQQDLGDQFTYVSGDTVFYRNNGEFFVLYNFGASIGDNWVISTSNPFGHCDDTSRIEVIDTGNVTINAVSYRFIKVQPTSNSPMGFRGTYVERFGNIDQTSAPFQYLFPGGYQCDSLSGIVEWNYYNFKCFKDTSFTLYNPSAEDCEYYLTQTGINERDQSRLFCYPNPTRGIINLIYDLPGDLVIEIFNSQGSLIRTSKMNENLKQVDISDLQRGLYLINIKSSHYGHLMKKIIKE